MWCWGLSPGNGSSRGPRKVTPSASEIVEMSKLRADLPQLGVEALAQRPAQVLRAGASAGPGLAADLSLHHQHMAGSPVREGLVVVEHRLAQVEEVAISL